MNQHPNTLAGYITLLSLAIAIVMFLSFPIVSKADGAVDGLALLAKADHIRNPSDSYKMRLKIESADDTTEFEVFLKGFEKTLIVTKSPAKDRGRNMLMLERDFYAFIPNLKKSMRLSLAQKMTGQVANGDIARTRWAGDYSVKVEASNAKETRLLLDANKKNLTYQKIRLWIETATAHPLRAEYLSLDGKTILKRAAFDEYKNLSGAQRPTRMKIEDTGNQLSTITILEMESTELSDAIFTTTNLEKAR
jgi:outer membrane lipoprotein-sorting protein